MCAISINNRVEDPQIVRTFQNVAGEVAHTASLKTRQVSPQTRGSR